MRTVGWGKQIRDRTGFPPIQLVALLRHMPRKGLLLVMSVAMRLVLPSTPTASYELACCWSMHSLQLILAKQDREISIAPGSLPGGLNKPSRCIASVVSLERQCKQPMSTVLLSPAGALYASAFFDR